MQAAIAASLAQPHESPGRLLVNPETLHFLTLLFKTHGLAVKKLADLLIRQLQLRKMHHQHIRRHQQGFARRHVQRFQIGQPVRFVQAETAGGGAAQRGQMRAAAQRLADVAAQRADIRPLGAQHVDLGRHAVERQQLQLADGDLARLARHLDAGARVFVQRLA